MAEKLMLAKTVEEALQLKDGKAAYLAGGTEVNRLGSSVDAETLVSIRKIRKLSGIRKEADKVWIGAATTFQEVIDHPDAPCYIKEACRLMASRTKRNMATLGGNIFLCRDDSYLLPTLLAAHADIVYCTVSGKNEEVCVCEYLEAREKGELADALILRIGLDPDRKIQLKRYANTAMSHSMLNIAYGCDADGKNVSIGAAIKNTGVFRLSCLENMIESDPSVPEERIEETVRTCEGLDLADDMYGSKEYKRYLLGVTVAKMAANAR